MNTSEIIPALQQRFATGHTRSLSWRLEQLRAIKQMILRNRRAWERALAEDLGKSRFDSWMTELSQVLAEIRHIERNLKRWMRPQRVKTPAALLPATSQVRHDPLGTVLIIAPWNYPALLLLSPLAGAVAAGNCVVLKPSEVSTRVEALIAELVPKYLDREAVAVVTGGAETVNELIDAKPDTVFFTGSSRVGTLIAERCARQLIPAVLELGGKSPVYVHRDADLKLAARRIVWGKFMNAGQTCVAPDHVYVHRAVADRFTRAVAREIRHQFGKNPRRSRDLGRIITTAHASRVAGLLDGATVFVGGEADPAQRYVEPTVIYPAEETDACMQEEIFGPILPILPVTGALEAISRIHTRPAPLALYVFTRHSGVKEAMLTHVASGGVAINTTLMHLSSPYLPFGGVGASGIGQYHGRWSFAAFSHERAVLEKGGRPDTVAMVRPPGRPVMRFLAEKLLLR